MTPEQKAWIDNASYEELLRKWRFTDSSEEYFQGELGEYFARVMGERRDSMSHRDKINASKRVGWDKP